MLSTISTAQTRAGGPFARQLADFMQNRDLESTGAVQVLPPLAQLRRLAVLNGRPAVLQFPTIQVVNSDIEAERD